jgi:hypothetical protein
MARRDDELARRATELPEWFRQTTPSRNPSGSSHAELMERLRTGLAGGIRPTFISDYLT